MVSQSFWPINSVSNQLITASGELGVDWDPKQRREEILPIPTVLGLIITVLFLLLNINNNDNKKEEEELFYYWFDSQHSPFKSSSWHNENHRQKCIVSFCILQGKIPQATVGMFVVKLRNCLWLYHFFTSSFRYSFLREKQGGVKSLVQDSAHIHLHWEPQAWLIVFELHTKSRPCTFILNYFFSFCLTAFFKSSRFTAVRLLKYSHFEHVVIMIDVKTLMFTTKH